MSIRCGNCRDRHVSVDEIKDCYAMTQREEEESKSEQAAEAAAERFFEEGPNGPVDDPIERDKWMMEDLARETRDIQQREREDDERAYASKPDVDLMSALVQSQRAVKFAVEEEEERAQRVLDKMTGTHGRDMASKAQISYVMDLLNDREWPDLITKADVENMERRQVSKLIDSLKTATRRDQVKSPLPEVPAGRYALLEGGDDAMSYSAVDRQDMIKFKEPTLRFYEVRESQRGTRWVQQLFGSPGDYRKEYVRGMRAARILEAIFKDPMEASIRYGKESGVCGVCHSPLTNKKSLDRGIGPVCAKKRGW